MEEHLSLTIALPVEHLPWLSARLLELGFPAFEERSAVGGVAVLVYDTSEQRLLEVQAKLRAVAVAASPAIALGFELSRLASDWALRWTEHLEPVRLTPSLTLVPRAPSAELRPDELYLAPAFAFGFGEHASTRLCAGWLERVCQAASAGSVLDVGCGTGVLSLVARRSGAARVLGLDTSLAAVQSARANAELNRISGVEFSQTPVAELSESFDCVVANIEAQVLLQLSAELVRRLSPGGELVLAGFIEEQSAELVTRFGVAGCALELRARQDDWCLLVGRRALDVRGASPE